MSSLRRLVCSSLLAMALTMLVAAVALGHDGRVHESLADSGRGGVVGKLVLDHGDDFATGRKVERYHLATAQGRVNLVVSGQVAAEPGATVRVHGRRVGSLLAVDETADGTAAIETVAAPSSDVPLTKRVLVLLINFTDDTSQPYSVATAHSTFFGSVAQYYIEASYGEWSTVGEVRGWWTIPDTNDDCEYSNWGLLARQRAVAEGIDLSTFTNIVYAFPSAGCGWSGLAQVNGPWSWLQGTSGMTTRVAAHELGHNYGAHHASTINCTSAGVRVTYSDSCTMNEYGDPFDVMGTGTRLNWAWHRKQMTLMPATDIVTVTGGTHTVQPVPFNGSVPKALRILRPDGWYWYVEFRQPFGAYDNFTAGAQPTNGVLIRLAPSSTRTQSRLVDASPATTSFSDAAFTPGMTFVDGINNIHIRVDSVTTSGATVTFNPTTGDTQAPTTPGSLTATAASSSSINLTWTASSDNVGVTGYEIRRDGVLIATPSGSATSFLDPGRTAGVTYNYSIFARDAAGNVSATATTTGFIEPTPDTQPPTTPGSFTATAASSSTINVTWTASSDNVGVTGYEIRRDGILIGAPGGSATSFLDTGLTAGVTYGYTIFARDAAGNVSGTAATSGFIPPSTQDTTPPSAPSNLTGSAANGLRVNLSWGASSDNVGVTGYRIYQNGVQVATSTTTSLTYKTTKGTKTFTVRAVDAAGNLSPASNSFTVTL